MFAICILIGVVQIICGIVVIATRDLPIAFKIIVAVTYFVSAAVYFYISYLGSNKVSKDDYEAENKELKKRLFRVESELAFLSAKLNVDLSEAQQVQEKCDSVEKGTKAELSVVLLAEKITDDGVCFKKGTKGTFIQRSQNGYEIKVNIDGKNYTVVCSANEFEFRNANSSNIIF